MGNNYKHDRLSGDFINLTDDVITLYDESGGFWILEPSTDSLPEAPASDPNKPLLHYIVKLDVAEKLRESGRPLDDIAIVSKKSQGRNGTDITYLKWGKNPTIIVRPYRDFKKQSFPSYSSIAKTS